MYRITPSRTYALERVYEDQQCVERMERIISAIGQSPNEVVRITKKNLPDVVAELAMLWPPDSVPPGTVRSFMRPLVFTTMDLSRKRSDLNPLLKRCAPGTSADVVSRICGHLTTAIDQHPHHLDQRNNCVCWPTYNFGTVSGCSHGCRPTIGSCSCCCTARGGR